MSIETNGELILSHDESVALISNMVHPNIDALRQRDVFLHSLGDVVFDNGEIIAVCPEINLSTPIHSLYDEKPSGKFDVTTGSISIEQGYESGLLSTPIFTFDKLNCPLKMIEKEKWTLAENAYQLIIPTAA